MKSNPVDNFKKKKEDVKEVSHIGRDSESDWERLEESKLQNTKQHSDSEHVPNKFRKMESYDSKSKDQKRILKASRKEADVDEYSQEDEEHKVQLLYHLGEGKTNNNILSESPESLQATVSDSETDIDSERDVKASHKCHMADFLRPSRPQPIKCIHNCGSRTLFQVCSSRMLRYASQHNYSYGVK